MTECAESLHPSISAVDLFCGAGGLTHGLARAGITVTAGIDIDPACRYPFEENNSAKFIEQDVQTLPSFEVSSLFHGGTYSLLAGCAPCQPFSTYSRSGRSSRYESEWPLVSSFGQLIRDTKPDLVTMENVPQLLDHPVFDEFRGELSDYSVSWSVVDCALYGIPQTRRRLVLLASRLGPDGLKLPAPSGAKKTVQDTIAHLPPLKAGDRSASDPLHVASSLSELNLRRIRASKPGGTWRDWSAELQAACHQRESGETYPSVYGRMEWGKVAPTITTQCFGYGNGRFGHPDQNRAISLREAAMLQTFPEDYRFVSDGSPVRFNALGRLIGNAVPVLLGEIIGKTLVSHVKRYQDETGRADR